MNYARISASALFVSLAGLILCFEYSVEPITEASPATGHVLSEGSRRLAMARLQDGNLALSQFVAEQRKRCQQLPETAHCWQLLAESLLERARTHAQDKGMVIGKPVFAKIPEMMAKDLEEGLAAIDRAHELAAEDAEILRIEAELLTAQITGLGSAIRLNGKISALIRKAAVLDPANPRLKIVLGCRKLFSPRFLGHDATAAKSYLLAAATSLDLDERPLLLAAMACHLLGEGDQARELLAEAAARNPNNRFVAAVARRMIAGEEDPFARDLCGESAADWVGGLLQSYQGK